MKVVLETERLRLSEFTLSDAPFVLKLVNTPDYIKYIIDRNVRSVKDAEQYVLNDPIANYHQYGFGQWKLSLKHDNTPIGSFGLKQRDYLDHPDIGFALMPEYYGKGYAYEAAWAIKEYALGILGKNKIHAFALPENKPSVKLIQKLGLIYDREIEIPSSGETLHLYSSSIEVNGYSIRKANTADLSEIHKLFDQTIRHVCSRDYTSDQIRVWTESINDKDRWIHKINTQFFLVALLNNQLVGFGSLRNNEYFDLLYVHKDFIHRGVGTVLGDRIELEVSRNGNKIIHADVSKTALSFFLKRNYKIEAENIFERSGVRISNFKTNKILN